MNKNLTVRKADIGDSASVFSLLRIIGDLHRNGRPDMFPNLTSKYDLEQVKARLSKENSGVFVATVDGSVIGYVFCEIIEEGDGYTVYVDDLCVDPMARRVGVGNALMDRAAEYGRERNCRYLMLNVWEFNSSAVEFYEKYGLKTRTRHLEMKL